MSTANHLASNASELLDTLTPEAISARLEELDRESRALRVLLRAAKARRRGQTKHSESFKLPGGAPNAS